MFETIYTILTRLDASEDVLGFWEPAEGSTHFRVDLNDFEGFTDEGEEIDREWSDPEMVEAFYEVLDTAERTEGDYYVTYYWADCSLTLGYTSYDI